MRLAVGLLALPLAVGGCQSASELFGLASGAAAGGATANPAVGYVVAIGVAVAADEAFKWYGRTQAHAAQQAVADTAASLPQGQAAPWHINHFIPIGNAHGEVRVVRVIDSPLTECRELAFSVEDKPHPPAWYLTSICRDTDGWHWSLAEPAVPRWGYLQQGG